MSENIVQDRLAQAFEYLRFKGVVKNITEAADKIGLLRPQLSSALNGDPKRLTEGLLRRFAAAFPEHIRAEWLIDGQGAMSPAAADAARPHVPLQVAAGPTGRFIGSALESDCDARPLLPGLARYDFTITVGGDSMEPALCDGDIIACAWLPDAEAIDPRRIYVVETREGAVVKCISRAADGLICHSLNPRFADYTIARTDVLRIARVVGVLRSL